MLLIDMPRSPEVPEAFRATLRDAAFFRLPKEAHSVKVEGDELERWTEFGIMPFNILATSVDLPPEDGSTFNLTSIIVAKNDNLPVIITHLEQKNYAAPHSLYAVIDFIDTKCVCGEAHGKFEVIAWHASVEASGDFERLVSDIGHYALRHFLWLTTALSSASYSATAEVISRQVSRATGQPRHSWIIEVRPARSAATSLREQFREVVRAAHAVRGHLRMDRDGQKRIRVRPHIRGRGELVQLKDYSVRECATSSQQSGIS